MTKTARKKTTEELYHLSREAIENPELIKIVLIAPVKKDGHINLTRVYKDAYDYALKNSNGDLQIAKRWAVSTRWAAKFKDEYWLEFETEVAEAEIKNTLTKAQQPKPEPKPEPKDVEIELFGDIILSDASLHPRRFLRIKAKNMPQRAIIMAQSFLEAITGVVYRFEGTERIIAHPVGLRNYLIQILEEKGLTIKICGNCEWFKPYPSHSTPDGRCRHPVNMYNGPWAEEQCNFGDHCHVNPDGWVSKKISEEKKGRRKKVKI